MSDEIIKAIDEEVRQNPVVIYMKGTPRFPMCGFSAATIEVLNEVGVPFKAIDILADQDKREGVKAYTSWPTIPQVFVGGKFVGGCDVVRELHARGELAPLIQKAVES
jgi:monothiol glutaredoxin